MFERYQTNDIFSIPMKIAICLFSVQSSVLFSFPCCFRAIKTLKSNNQMREEKNQKKTAQKEWNQ